MRARAWAIGAGAALVVGSYIAADAYDVVPGVLTRDPPPADPVPYPSLTVAPADAPPMPAADPDTHAGSLQGRVESFVRDADALGADLAVQILDVPSGTVLASVGADTAHTTASSVKLLPAVAALHALGPDHVIATTVLYDAAGGRVTLQGTGDMRLTAEDLAALATQTHSALAAEGVGAVRVDVDDSAFSGPALSPAWGDLDLAWVQPVMALGVNSGKSDGVHADADPALAAGKIFSDALRAAGTQVHGTGRAAAADGAVTVASHESTTVADLVTHTLKTSDNTTSEVTARLVAIARGESGTRDAGRAAVAAELTDAGFDVSGVHLADACGLDSATKVPARVLAGLVRAAAAGDDETLGTLIPALPVAHLDGTLKTRLAPAAGAVRAKTGTLVTAISLTGLVQDGAGRQFAFAVLAPGVEEGAFEGARAELDAFIATLAGAGAS